MITMVNLITICHHTKILHNYWLIFPTLYISYPTLFCNWKFLSLYLSISTHFSPPPSPCSGNHPYIVLTIQGLVCFHTNFRIICSSSVENTIGILIGIAMNLDNFGLVILTILSLLSYDYGIIFQLFVCIFLLFCMLFKLSNSYYYICTIGFYLCLTLKIYI